MQENKKTEAFNEIYRTFKEANLRRECTQNLLLALPCTESERKAINFALTLFGRAVDRMIQINEAKEIPAQTKLQEAAKLCNIMHNMEKCEESRGYMQSIYYDLDLCRAKLLQVGVTVNV